MNLFAALLAHPLTHRLGWTLLHTLWQGALAAVVLGILRVLLRGRSPQARYLAACCILLALAAAPLLTFVTAMGCPHSVSEAVVPGLASRPPGLEAFADNTVPSGPRLKRQWAWWSAQCPAWQPFGRLGWLCFHFGCCMAAGK